MRTLLLNLWVFILLLAALVLLPPLVFDGVQWARVSFGAGDPRATLPNYQGVPWAREHFREFAKISTSYQDFIGWRRDAFEGQTIHVDTEGYRRHPGSPARDKAAVWVFGGSTVWGPGSDDAGTLPGQLQAVSGQASFNLGESAYTAHQSLNLLMKAYLQGGRPRHVVFYDGANEVVIKCRAELGFYSTSHEATIRARMHGASLSPQLISPSMELLGRGLRSLSGAREDKGYDCHDNEAKRKLIAANLVMDWQLARELVERNGGHFVAVLQPVSFTGAPRLDYLPDVVAAKALRLQYEAVYPEIRKQLAEAGIRYLDLSRVLDGQEPLYIDFAHVSPRGNELIARAIAPQLN